MNERIEETRVSWLWYFLKWAAYTEPRPATPREMELNDALADANAEIARLHAVIEDMVEAQADAIRIQQAELKGLKTEMEKLQSKNEMMELDCELAAELHQRTVNKIRAEGAAYAKLIPPDEAAKR